MKTMTFHLPFLLISIIFINKLRIKFPFPIPNIFPFPLPISFSYNKPNVHPLGWFSQHSTWISAPQPWSYIFFLHEFLTRTIIETSPMGEHHPWCSMTPIKQQTIENKTYYLWSFITQLVAVFIMTTIKHDKHIVYWSFITQLVMVFTITITYTHTHFLQPKNNHTIYGAL